MIPTNRVPLYHYTKKARKVKKNLPGRELVSWGDTKFMVCIVFYSSVSLSYTTSSLVSHEIITPVLGSFFGIPASV